MREGVERGVDIVDESGARVGCDYAWHTKRRGVGLFEGALGVEAVEARVGLLTLQLVELLPSRHRLCREVTARVALGEELLPQVAVAAHVVQVPAAALHATDVLYTEIGEDVKYIIISTLAESASLAGASEKGTGAHEECAR